MAYEKFNTKDNAQGQLLASINSSVTSIVLKSWQGALYPSTKFIVTLTEVTAWVVTKMEKCLCTSRSWDTLTVTRGYDGSTAQSFTADDYVTLMVNSTVIVDIQDEVTRLETDKLNKAGGTRTGLTNWRLYYSNGSGAETALALGTSWQVLQSNGATSDPTFVSPSVDINWLTNDDTNPVANDKILRYKDWTGNRKRTMIASETVMWLVECATDAEAIAWTDTTRYVTPAHLTDVTNASSAVYTFSATTTQVVTHWLWRTPKFIDVEAFGSSIQTDSSNYWLLELWSSWSWDWTTNKCIYRWRNWTTTGSASLWTTTSNCIYLYESWSNHRIEATIWSVNSTTYTLTVTKTWTNIGSCVVHLKAS